MYKKKSNMLMSRGESSDKILDRSLEECFNELSEDIDMNMFLKNLKHLKDNMGTNPELVSAVKNKAAKKPPAPMPVQLSSRNMLKRQPVQSNRAEREEVSLADSRRQIVLPVHKIVIKNKSAEKLTDRMSKLEEIVKNKLIDEKERSRTREKMDESKFVDFYSRLENHKLKTQAKINIIKTKKNLEEREQMTFTPNINPKSANMGKNGLDVNAVDLRAKEEKIKHLQMEKQQKEEEKLKKECTFKPSINKIENDKPRSLNDLYKWKERMEVKINKTKNERENEMKKEYTFSPNINKSFNDRRDQGYENPGDRLYAIHKVKLNDKAYQQTKVERMGDNVKRANLKSVSRSFRQGSREPSRHSANTSFNNSRVSEPYRKSNLKGGEKVRLSSSRDITPKIQARFSSNMVSKPTPKLFNANKNSSQLDNSGISKDKLNIKKVSLKRSASKNFMEENVRKLREEERVRKEQKIAKETNKTQKRKYYNAKKDSKIRLGNLESIVKDMSEIESYFYVK